MAHWRSVLFDVPEAQRLADLTRVESDLRSTEEICERFIAETEKEPTDHGLLEILRAAAMVRCGRSSTSGVRVGVNSELVGKLDYVRDGERLVRFDNEAGKGDHRHIRGKESKYRFVAPEKLVQDFLREARRVEREDSDS